MLIVPCLVSARDYNVVSFGAVPDGITINTKAIQSAIDQASKDGGGRVIVPNGRFLSGTILMKSDVELFLARKAILMGSTDPIHYKRINRWKGLIMADGEKNITVSGQGTIDGQGAQLALNIDSLFYNGTVDSSDYVFPEKRPRVTIRPQVIEFVKCRNVKVCGITIKNSASWVQTYDLCYNLLIDKIHVDSDTYWNNDGIDIIDSKNVRITNSYINSSDDGICLKSYNYARDPDVFCDSIYIGNCTVRSSASAIKLGTASYGGFRNVVIEKIKVFDTFRSAVALESWDDGTLENVLIQDIKAVNTGNAIFVRLGKRYKDHRVGKLKNVTIRNVRVKVPFHRPDAKYEIRGPALPFFHNTFPASITGIPGYPVENLTLENIEIIYPGRGNKAYANLPIPRLEDVPEEIDKYPEFSMFGELPAWGFYVRHVTGLTMKNIRVKIRKPDYRPAFVFDDVKQLRMESIQVDGDKKDTPIILNNVEKIDDGK